MKACDYYTWSILIGGKAEPVQVRFTLRLRDQRSMWMKDGYKVYTDSYTASNGSCFIVTWIIFKNHLLEVGLTQTRVTMALQTLTTAHNRWFTKFHHVWGPACIEIHWNNIWLSAWSHVTSHYTRGSVTTLHDDFGGCVGTIALHWVPIPMPVPTHTHGFWVGTGAMLLFMGGHGFCASLHPTPNRSQTSKCREYAN